MQTKLEQLLRSLEARELRELQRFLESSFLNERSEVLPLLAFLRAELKTGHFPDRATIAIALHPEGGVTDLQLRRLMSYLTKGIEKYLVWKEMTADSLVMDLHLLKAYRQRRIGKGFQAVAARIEKTLAAKNGGDENFHFHRYSFELERYNFSVNRAGKEPPQLTGILKELDHFYIANKLKQACNALSHQRLFKFEYEIALLDVILAYIRTADLLRIPVIAIYYQSYMTLTSEDETHFYALRKSMDAHIAFFNEEEKRTIFMLAINYCIRQLNQGRPEFLREVFELYQKALAANILLENGQMSHWTYKNIVSAALKLREFNWTASFLEEFRPLLAPAMQGNGYAFNKAQLFFAREAFRDALRLLLPITFSDLFTQLDARLLTIKCYFELKELDAVEYQLDSFRQLLRRKKLLTYHRQHYQSFIDFTWSLLRSKDGVALRKAILDSDVLAEKAWLLRQL